MAAELREQKLPAVADMTTIGVGGPCARFIAAITEEEVKQACMQLRPEFYAIGEGSNILFSDEGPGRPLLKAAILGISVTRAKDNVSVYAGSGENWDALVARCVEDGLAGIECLAGIPGLVGAAPIQNIGAYGQQLSDTLGAVRAYDLLADQFVELSPTQLRLGYRTSLFKQSPGRYIVVGLRLRLRRAPPAPPTYAALQRRLGVEAHQPSLRTVREAVLELRRHKSMLYDANDHDSRSLGSFFLNPVISGEQAATLLPPGSGSGPHAPLLFPVDQGRVKVPAAWLIEQAGFPKGYRLGKAGLSAHHTLAIVNRGEATAGDILALAARIQSEVRKMFGISLEPEPSLIGFAPEDLPLGRPLPPLCSLLASPQAGNGGGQPS